MVVSAVLLYKPHLSCVKPHKIVIKITINMGNEPDVDVKCDPGSVDNATDTAKNKNAGAQAGLQRPPNASLAEPAAGSGNAGVKAGTMDGVEQCPEIPKKNSHVMPKNDGTASIARHIPITPLDAFILHMLHFSDRDMTADEISENVRKWFGETKSIDIRISLVDILVDGLMYVNERRVKAGDGNILSRYAASAKARDEYFSIPRNNQRKKIVLETMSQIVEEQRRMGRYCKYNLGNSVKYLPSLMVLEPDTYQSGNQTLYSPDRWNPKTITAIDVKTDPLKHHKGQVYNNWQKNTNQNICTFFIVFNPKHVDVIENILKEYGADKTTYSIRVITRGMVKDNKAGDQEITQLPDHQYIPECATKPILENTLKSKLSYGLGAKKTAPIDGTPAGKPENTTPIAVDGKSMSVPKAGGCLAKTKETKKADTEPVGDLKTRYMAHMSSLEHDIYHAINEGLSTDPELIRKRLGKKEYVSDSSIRKAVSNLCKKKYVIIDYQTKLNKMDSLRGKGPKKHTIERP